VAALYTDYVCNVFYVLAKKKKEARGEMTARSVIPS